MQTITSGWITSSLDVLGRFASGPRRALVTIACGIGIVVAGCADPHPTVEAAESFSLADVHDGTSASASTAPARRICSPGTARECKKTWYDREGRVHCNLDVQICRADGYAWQDCGDSDAGLSPDAGSDIEAG